MITKIENIVGKFLEIIPIRIRYYIFHGIVSLQFKMLSSKIKFFHEITISNYKRYLNSENNSKSSTINFYSKFLKCRNTQAADFLTFVSASKKEMRKKININFQGKELLDKYISQNKGVILVLPHISSYTSLSLILAKYLKIRTNVIALSPEMSFLFESNIPDRWAGEFLDRVNLIKVGYLSLVNAYAALKKGELLLIMPELATTSFSDKESYTKFMFDLNAPVNKSLSDYKVSFLGETVYAAPGIVKLSMKTEAPTLFTVIRKNGNLDYDVAFNEIEFSKHKEDLQENIQLLYQTVEKEVLIEPYEWSLWSFFHKLKYVSSNSHTMVKNED